jgi:tRNA(Ile)-lysidine synthase TilS/MesJ
LPLLTGRQFIGGLDPDGFIEHSSISLMNQDLAGTPIAAWTDQELQEYCGRYNVRWIVAWSPAVIERFEKWSAAQKCQPVADEGPGWLFQVKRTSNFALKGRAELLRADGQHITLGNVEPDNGEVIVSLHWQAGMRAIPPRVQLERAQSGDDRIGFVRLRLAVPADRVTLSWQR